MIDEKNILKEYTDDQLGKLSRIIQIITDAIEHEKREIISIITLRRKFRVAGITNSRSIENYLLMAGVWDFMLEYKFPFVTINIEKLNKIDKLIYKEVLGRNLHT